MRQPLLPPLLLRALSARAWDLVPVLMADRSETNGRPHADLEAFRKIVARALRQAHCAMQTRRIIPLGVVLDRRDWETLQEVLGELEELTQPVRRTQ